MVPTATTPTAQKAIVEDPEMKEIVNTLLAKQVSPSDEVERIAQFILRLAEMQGKQAPEMAGLLEKVKVNPERDRVNQQMVSVCCDVFTDRGMNVDDLKKVVEFLGTSVGSKWSSVAPQLYTMQKMKELSLAHTMVSGFPEVPQAVNEAPDAVAVSEAKETPLQNSALESAGDSSS